MSSPPLCDGPRYGSMGRSAPASADRPGERQGRGPWSDAVADHARSCGPLGPTGSEGWARFSSTLAPWVSVDPPGRDGRRGRGRDAVREAGWEGGAEGDMHRSETRGVVPIGEEATDGLPAEVADCDTKLNRAAPTESGVLGQPLCTGDDEARTILPCNLSGARTDPVWSDGSSRQHTHALFDRPAPGLALAHRTGHGVTSARRRARPATGCGKPFARRGPPARRRRMR